MSLLDQVDVNKADRFTTEGRDQVSDDSNEGCQGIDRRC